MRCEHCERTTHMGGTFCHSCGVHRTVIDTERKIRVVQLWRMLGPGDVIQPDDCYASSLCGKLFRCTPDMMGKRLPYLAMPHLRPAGTREETMP